MTERKLTPRIIRNFNRWAQARLGSANARDQYDNTRIAYRNEAVAAADVVLPDNYTIWPVTSGDVAEPEDGTWFQRTVAWEAWQTGSPDILIGTFKVKNHDSFGVLDAVREACEACVRDCAFGGPNQRPNIVETVTGEKFDYVFDPAVFSLIDGKVYLNHAQIYSVLETYRRAQRIPVCTTHAVRREMNRRHTRGDYTAVGPRGQRKWHIADVAHYASYGSAGVKSVTGMSEDEMVRLITTHQAEERRPKTCVVPQSLIEYASQYIDWLRADLSALRADISGAEHRDALIRVSDELHDILGDTYAVDETAELREESAAIYGRKRS